MCARAFFFIIFVFIVAIVVVVYTVTRILTRITTKPPAQGDKQLPRRSSSPSTQPLPSPPRYNIIHTLALAYTHHAELLLLYIVVTRYIQYYIYIYVPATVYFLFFNFFSSIIFVRSVSARPVSVGNYSVISVTLPLLYDDVII